VLRYRTHRKIVRHDAFGTSPLRPDVCVEKKVSKDDQSERRRRYRYVKQEGTRFEKENPTGCSFPITQEHPGGQYDQLELRGSAIATLERHTREEFMTLGDTGDVGRTGVWFTCVDTAGLEAWTLGLQILTCKGGLDQGGQCFFSFSLVRCPLYSPGRCCGDSSQAGLLFHWTLVSTGNPTISPSATVTTGTIDEFIRRNFPSHLSLPSISHPLQH
jgi:hypothetical protein